LIRETEKNMENNNMAWVWDKVTELRKELEKQNDDLDRLYRMYPEIKPPRVQQLDLFSKKRQTEERKILKSKSVRKKFTGFGAGKSFSMPKHSIDEYPEPSPEDMFFYSIEEAIR
jgi:hypothetical protein